MSALIPAAVVPQPFQTVYNAIDDGCKLMLPEVNNRGPRAVITRLNTAQANNLSLASQTGAQQTGNFTFLYANQRPSIDGALACGSYQRNGAMGGQLQVTITALQGGGGTLDTFQQFSITNTAVTPNQTAFFQLPAPVTIPSWDGTGTAPTVSVNIFEGLVVNQLFSGDGTNNQTLITSSPWVLDRDATSPAPIYNGLAVQLYIAGNWTTINRVVRIGDAAPTDKVYLVNYTNQEKAIITGGDGFHGEQFPSDDGANPSGNISVYYQVYNPNFRPGTVGMQLQIVNCPAFCNPTVTVTAVNAAPQPTDNSAVVKAFGGLQAITQASSRAPLPSTGASPATSNPITSTVPRFLSALVGLTVVNGPVTEVVLMASYQNLAGVLYLKVITNTGAISTPMATAINGVLDEKTGTKPVIPGTIWWATGPSSVSTFDQTLQVVYTSGFTSPASPQRANEAAALQAVLTAQISALYVNAPPFWGTLTPQPPQVPQQGDQCWLDNYYTPIQNTAVSVPGYGSLFIRQIGIVTPGPYVLTFGSTDFWQLGTLNFEMLPQPS